MDHADAFAAEHLIERAVNLLSRSWIRKRIRSNRPVKLRLRACWRTQAPVGFLVQPAQCDRLDGKEVAGDDARGLLTNERRPRCSFATRRRVDPQHSQALAAP